MPNFITNLIVRDDFSMILLGAGIPFLILGLYLVYGVIVVVKNVGGDHEWDAEWDRIEEMRNAPPPFSADKENPMKHIYQNQGYAKALDDLLSQDKLTNKNI